jgi:CHAT domain-containing protein/tetratricopeptide (TPR) repeat protein
VFLARLSLLTVLLVVSAGPTRGQTADSLYADSLFKMGVRYDKAHKFDSAVTMMEKARTMFPPGSAMEEKACNDLGDIFKYDLHDFAKAEVNYERALAITLQNEPSNTRKLTRAYYNLATTNRSQHDYETALSWSFKTLDASLHNKDEVYIEYSYSIIGSVYRDLNEFDSAVVYYKKAVSLDEKLNHGKPNDMLASLYGNWGAASFMQNDLEEAAKKLSYAVSLHKKIQDGDKSIFFHSLRLLATVEIRRNKLASAESVLALASGIMTDNKMERGGQVSELYQAYGDLFAAKNNKEEALTYYNMALVATMLPGVDTYHVSKVEFKDFAYRNLLAKAALLDEAEALEAYADAEVLMMASRRELDTEDAKWRFVDANYRLYERIFQALDKLQTKDDSLLFHFMESSKSKSLSDALQEAELKKVLGQGSALITRLRDLRQRSISLQHQIDEKNEPRVRDELISIGQEISQLEEEINLKYPSYIRTRYENNSTSIRALKDKLRKMDAALVEYFWGDENVYAFAISADSSSLRLVGKTSDVEAVVAQYRALLTTKGNRYSVDDVHQLSGTSYKLYSLLLRPFTTRRIVIVPDGPLMQVPFETLVTTPGGDTYNQLDYLLNDHVVSYLFSASQLLAKRQPPKNELSLVAFGFTGGASERSTDGSNIEIAGTETELLALSEKFPGGTFLYGDGVTEKNFKDNAAKFDVIHLAVHGSGDTGEDYSATLYFRDKDGPEDGRLYWYELYNMNLRASLAVLSSCESGIGKTYRGEGMLSMANAFTFAGCGNIVMGLWKVDDQVSVKLMDTFYSELLNGMAIDEALAIAKRTYLASADQVSANPKLWGSLVAFGETPVLRADEIPISWVVIALTVLLGGIILLVIKTRKK